ncbi:efflux RND transporter periplasmic adaptor subunit [Thalassotalea euphylliae]|uniref:Efflux RND transporter periplasmic adaptor subunit n=1 Tax=Thalassotalea euphylliae TaxID=1655234 RepID=A0A3E0TTC2_9GAMM|nr:efflux RND transporter periplasmic adaptor subunit [Thalassotalea euphylliae]REL27788.1 efflux RND transporter periplasmic adaptor subunit [Thalassotalea euphylliae]
MNNSLKAVSKKAKQEAILQAGSSQAQADSSQVRAGAGMDRKIAKQKSPWPKFVWGGVAIGILVWLLAGISGQTGGKMLSVSSQRVVISAVSRGTFEDFIPVRGRVAPAKTLFLDAIEGGRVERILVEDGAALEAGDLIVELSNASLQLSVLGNEARVAEQLNNMRSIELSLEQNRLRHKRNLIDIEHQIKLLTRQVAREQELVTSGAVSQSQFDDTRDTLQWYKNQREVTLESQASDTRMQESQLAFLKQTGERLESNLAISRENLENMKVRAPVSGKLSGFNIEVGQSIGRGERLGQIDTPNDYKVTAFIDEFYLGRVDIGQAAVFEQYPLTISKIYPQVQNGQFEVDFTFSGEQPNGIRRGQTVQTKLTLGDASKALLLPNGAFYQDTGGKWVFVVSDDGSEAVKRSVRLGRRNNQFIEVLDGLEQGERVITSPYSSYRDIERLVLASK